MKYIWLTGSEEEIEELKEAFRANGFSFSQGEHFEISNSPFGPGRFSSSLKDFRPLAFRLPSLDPMTQVRR